MSRRLNSRVKERSRHRSRGAFLRRVSSHLIPPSGGGADGDVREVTAAGSAVVNGSLMASRVMPHRPGASTLQEPWSFRSRKACAGRSLRGLAAGCGDGVTAMADLPWSAASLRVDLRALPCSRHFEPHLSFPAAPFGRPRRVLHVRTDSGEGPVERRQAHSSLPSRLRGAISRAWEARTVPLQPGRPLGAPPWRFAAGVPNCPAVEPVLHAVRFWPAASIEPPRP